MDLARAEVPGGSDGIKSGRDLPCSCNFYKDSIRCPCRNGSKKVINLQAWRLWTLDSDPSGCYQILLSVVKEHPSDLFAVKRGHIMGLIVGSGEHMLEILQPVLSGAERAPFLHGMWAFALEQQGSYKEAERVAREGLERTEGDAWLDHALAHALYFQGTWDIVDRGSMRCSEDYLF